MCTLRMVFLCACHSAEFVLVCSCAKQLRCYADNRTETWSQDRQSLTDCGQQCAQTTAAAERG